MSIPPSFKFVLSITRKTTERRPLMLMISQAMPIQKPSIHFILKKRMNFL
jgi:hypothetical protein